MSLNKIFLIGNCGSDPDVRVLQGGAKVAKVNVATTERYKDKAGDVKEQTEWHYVTVWGKAADFVEKYVRKGMTVFVEGKVTTREYTDASGATKRVTEVKCDNIQLLSKREDKPKTSNFLSDDDMPDI